MVADRPSADILARLQRDVAFLARPDISAAARDVVRARVAALLVAHVAWIAELAAVVLGADADAIAGIFALGFTGLRELERTDPSGAARIRAVIAAEVQRWYARDAVPLEVGRGS